MDGDATLPTGTSEADEAILRAAGWVPSARVDGWWCDAGASERDYPAWRAVEIARRDERRNAA